VVDRRYLKGLVLDASPLIYLAKIEAIDVLESLTERVLIPRAVLEETTRPALLYQHPDAAVIERAVREGVITAIDLDASETATTDDLTSRVPALHAGVSAVLAIALHRGIPAVLFERRARRVAAATGAELVDVVELLFAGTPQADLLATRVRRFAELVNMRLSDYEALRERVNERTME
jgi:predicted nucleic acid-binding protein